MTSSSTSPPIVSVVVVAFNGHAVLTRCLAALAAQWEPTRAELLVVGHRSDGSRQLERLRNRVPSATWVAAPASHNVARMRVLGMSQSRGEIVVLLEDDCVPADGWLDRFITLSSESWGAIGGAIEPGGFTRAHDWAAYFTEYSRFMLPLPEGSAAALPGTNIGYRRRALAGVLDQFADGFYETFANRAISEAGHVLRREPTLVVYNIHTWSPSALLAARYHHGRVFAGLRLAGQPVWRRTPYLGLAFLLPPVLVSRILRQIASRRRNLGAATRALPWIILCATAWALGEFVGYLRGPGDSLERWR